MTEGRPGLAWRAAAVALAAAAVACGSDGAGSDRTGSDRAAPPQRIVLIVVDTLRRDHLTSYGAAGETPHIAALAARGQVFTNVLASFHQTSMSMGALFTGRTPSIEFTPKRPLFWNSQTWCGMNRFSEPGDEACIPASVPTLAEALRTAGYWTIGVVSNQFLYEPGGLSRGFDDWTEVGERPSEPGPWARLGLENAARTRTWLHVNRAVTAALNRRSTDHFFLYVHYMDVHDYDGRGVAYTDAVRTVDAAVGRLLENLDSVSLLDDAVVLLTSDHGERLDERHALPGSPGHIGNPTFGEHLRIPLVIAPPVVPDPERFLRTQDVHHLIREIAGAPAAPREGPLGDDELFVSETLYRTYFDGRFKSSTSRKEDRLVLFDLEEDPGETRDVAAEHPEVVARHRRRIDELSEALSAKRAVVEKMRPEDRERLRALGYLDDDDLRD